MEMFFKFFFKFVSFLEFYKFFLKFYIILTKNRHIFYEKIINLWYYYYKFFYNV